MKTLSNKHLELLPDLSNARTQKFTSIALTLVALSFFGLFAINPTLSTIAKLRKEISDYEIVNQKLEQKITTLKSLQQTYSRFENDVPYIFESIPQSALVPLFIGQVQSVAKGSNVRLSHLQSSQVDLFKENGDLKRYYFYSFSLTGEGFYEDILKFIENVTNMQRMVNIDLFSIKKVGAENRSLQFNLQAVTYYKK